VKILVVILTAIINALLPWLARKSRTTAQDGDPDIGTREKLRKKVKDFWLISILILMEKRSRMPRCGSRMLTGKS